MGRKCNVQDCLSDSRREEDQGVTFHKMPPHNDLRPKWISLCRIPEKQQLNKVIYVCSRHFLRADFCKFKGSKYFLKQGALPSVFPWAPKVAQADGGSSVSDRDVDTDTDARCEVKSEAEDSDTESSAQPAGPEPCSQSAGPGQVGAGQTESGNVPPTVAVGSIDDFKLKEEDMFATGRATTVPRPPCVDSINFTAGVKIEASDFGDQWYPARIVEVDYDENEVLVHYEKCSNRGDEWIPMDSSRLRPHQPQQAGARLPVGPRRQDPFRVGDKCLAVWVDARRFPATVTRVLDDDTYEVLFDDGFRKVLKRGKLCRWGEAQPSPECRVHLSPLFDPVVGSKEERRERKRRLNVAELFSTKKRCRHEDNATGAVATAADEDEQPAGEEWTCRWVDGEPVGQEAVLESLDGPRRSVIVPDHRLPAGWQKHLSQRVHGSSAGKWETIIRSPEGKRFRTRSDVRAYLLERGLAYAVDQFDFSLHLNRARKLGLYEVTGARDVAGTDAPPPVQDVPAGPRAARHARPAGPRRAPVVAAAPASTDDEPGAGPGSGATASSCLKIVLENDSYKCPIEGCGKTFRKENLAQMHIKHYHPEYTRFMGCTPNVADLAYARTVGEAMEGAVPRPRLSAVRAPPARSASPPAKDAEIIRLLSSDPVCDARPADVAEPVTAPRHPDIRLKDLLHRAEPLPARRDESRPGIRTLLPVVRPSEEAPRRDPPEPERARRRRRPAPAPRRDADPGAHSAGETPPPPVEQQPATPQPQQQPAQQPAPEQPAQQPQQPPQPQPPQQLQPPQPQPQPQVIIEGGEVIRLVHMRREEIINCTCGVTEEDGLMIQCELCLCWQHGHCSNILRENQVPDKYVCYICTHPQRQRPAQRHLHDQDWLKQGALPAAAYRARDADQLARRADLLRRSHELSGGLVELAGCVHNLRVKLAAAADRAHPKLYLWARPWARAAPEPPEPPEPPAAAGSAFGVLSLRTVLEPPAQPAPAPAGKIHSQSELLSILEGSSEQERAPPAEPAEPGEPGDRLLCREHELGGVTGGLLGSGSGPLELPLTQADLDKLSALAQLGAAAAPPAPQPEAAIDPADCQANLRDHIEFFQGLVERRLDAIEAQVAELERQEPDPFPEETHDSCPRTKQTLQMLVRDLDTMRHISAVSH